MDIKDGKLVSIADIGVNRFAGLQYVLTILSGYSDRGGCTVEDRLMFELSGYRMEQASEPFWAGPIIFV